ncbi:MAG: ABC transporter permease subunit [Planctomycetes bacterium]|nr:ABC transporter permease subunit [Planctomycetota bacterium]
MTVIDSDPQPAPAPHEDRHSTPEAVTRLKRARLADRTAGRLIRIGGLGVLVAVVAIFVFVGAEALPLLRGARLTQGPELKAASAVAAVATDEYVAGVSAVLDTGELVVLDAKTGAVLRTEAVLPRGRNAVASVDVRPNGQLFVAGSADGKLAAAWVTPKVKFDAQRVRTVTEDVELTEPLAIREDGGAITRVAARLFEEDKVFAAVAGPKHLSIARFKLGAARARVATLDAPAVFDQGAEVRSLSVALITDVFRVFVGLSDGRVLRFDAEWSEEPALHESIEVSKFPVTALDTLIGGETLVTGTSEGRVASWFGVRASTNAQSWDLTRIRNFNDVGAEATVVAASARKKGFAVFCVDGSGRIDFATTGDTRVSIPASGAPATAASFSPKNDTLLVGDASGRIRTFAYSDPHPEASVTALFGKLWYEGATEPEMRWQSTGGTDDFEPKLSISVLVFGTLKGVVFALLFSVPIALLAAIYTALFLPTRIKAIVKPTLEIMAALPSVVVGLLAALWLSPLAERNLASAFAMVPSFLLCFATLVVVWALLPRHVRNAWTHSAGVLGVSAIAVLLAVALAACCGGVVESMFFGGDVKAWMRETLGLGYDPRNAMVVGFAMGFAVIPVIFTIAEDAISNVPKSLWAASEALGASRWQTTIRVVLPAATPGIFAALMLGFGRAIGETMIVLMATGNTPILDMSPFNGMRTISACIAVEIPEAPHGDTLYRVLFLSGTLLFVFTFLCNTVAEVVASRLRRRYGRAG